MQFMEGEYNAVEARKFQLWENALLEGGMAQEQVESIAATYHDAYVAYECRDLLQS